MELITDIDFEPGHPQNIVLGWITSFVDVIDFKKWMNYIVMNCIKDGSIMSYSPPTGKINLIR